MENCGTLSIERGGAMKATSLGSEMETAKITTQIVRLMVAYDFSAFAEIALEYAVRLAQSYGAEIHIVYVKPFFEAFSEDGSLASMKEERDQALLDIEAVAQRLRKVEIKATAACYMGNPADVLVELAADHHPDILFMGAYGHPRSDSKHLGSTAEFLIRSLPCATFIIGPNVALDALAVNPFHAIIYATSDPSRTGRALDLTLDFARRFSSAIQIVHVVDPESHRRHPSEREIVGRGLKLSMQLIQTGIEAHWQISRGEMAEEILRCAKQGKANLIVFGIEHPTANPNIVGAISVVIQNAACPVLAVPGVA